MVNENETSSVPLTLDEINLILGTFEDQEFDKGEDDDGEPIDDDGEPADGSEQAIANAIVDKLNNYKKHFPNEPEAA